MPEIRQQSIGRFTGKFSGQVPRIVFNAVAVADAFYHFNVVFGSPLKPLRLQ